MERPGEWLLAEEPVEINAGRRTVQLTVRNTGDRPVQVGSHFHFFEVNSALEFDRPRSLGMRLNVPAGSTMRFEAGDEKDVELVEYGGMRRVIGFNSLVDGAVTAPAAATRALERARSRRFVGPSDGRREIQDSRAPEDMEGQA